MNGSVCEPASSGLAPFLPRRRSLKASGDKVNSQHMLLPYLTPSVTRHLVQAQGTLSSQGLVSSLFMTSPGPQLPVLTEDCGWWGCPASISPVPASVLETPGKCRSLRLCPFCSTHGTHFPGNFCGSGTRHLLLQALFTVTSSECLPADCLFPALDLSFTWPFLPPDTVYLLYFHSKWNMASTRSQNLTINDYLINTDSIWLSCVI